MAISRRTITAAIGGATALALLATGCSSTASGDTSAGGKTTLTVTTFGTFGYDDLYKKYEASHPGITIKANNIDTGGNAKTDTFTKLAAGSGLSDVVAIEEGWLGSIVDVSDQFVDLRDFGITDRKKDWLDWKVKQATDTKGRIIGYGTDIGPEGLCYNGKLFAAAGLPSDRAEVATLLGGEKSTWQNYFDLGAKYHAASGKAWYDHSGFIWNAMVNQLPEGYYTAGGKLNVENNAELKERFAQLAIGATGGLSAAQTAWDWNGGKSFVDGTFATFACPGWMLGVIKGQLESGGGDSATGWDFADVFPGGPANWGGSFLSIPKTSKHQKEAAALASWLTEPAQQIAQFEAAGTFPSTVVAQTDLAKAASPNALFNNAPVGAILAGRAEGVVAQFKGPDDSVIQENVFGPALQSLDRGETDGPASWNKALGLLEELVK